MNQPSPGTTFYPPLNYSIPALKPLSSRKYCAECGSKFSIFKHQYHCQNCGEVVCNSCSESRLSIPKFGHNSAVRVCKLCDELLRMQYMDTSQLSELPIKVLRKFIKLYNLPSHGLVEKSDLIKAIQISLPITDASEIYFRTKRPVANPRVSADDTNTWRNSRSSNDPAPQISTSGSSKQSSRPRPPPRRNSTDGSTTQGGPDFVTEFTNFLSNPIGTLMGSSNNSTNRSQQSQQAQYHGYPGSHPSRQQFQPYAPPPQQPYYQHPANPPQFRPHTPPNHPQFQTYATPSPQQQYFMPPFNNQEYRSPSTQSQTSYSPPPQPSFAQSSSTQNGSATNKNDGPPPSLKMLIDMEIDPATLPIKTLKALLKQNAVEFSHMVEKSELVKAMKRLIEDKKAEMKVDVDKLPESQLCVICCDAVQNCVFLECGHLCACMDCGRKLVETKNECPICREPIIKLLHVFRT